MRGLTSEEVEYLEDASLPVGDPDEEGGPIDEYPDEMLSLRLQRRGLVCRVTYQFPRWEVDCDDITPLGRLALRIHYATKGSNHV